MQLRHSTWVFFVFGILAVAFGLLTYGSTVESLLFHESHRTAELQLHALATQISTGIEERSGAVAAVAKREVWADSLAIPSRENLEQANTFCDTVALAMHPAIAYLMDRDGAVVASSNRHETTSFLGKNYSFRRYFSEATKGHDSVYLAVGVTSRERGVYYGSPVSAPGEGRAPLGVLVVKRSIETIDEEFSELGQLGEIVLVSEHEVVFSSTVPDWLFGTLRPVGREEREVIAQTRQYGEGPWPWIGLRVENGHLGSAADGSHYFLHEEKIEALPRWKLIYLHDLGKTQGVIVTPLVRGALLSVLPGILILIALSVVLFVSVQRGIGREKQLVAELTTALEEVKTIQGLLPICSYCKKIRTDEGAWDGIEEYLTRHTDATFSHGVCPDCMQKAYQDMGLDWDG